MMVCLCVSSPKNIPFNKEKPKHAERWVVVQLPDGFWDVLVPILLELYPSDPEEKLRKV